MFTAAVGFIGFNVNLLNVISLKCVSVSYKQCKESLYFIHIVFLLINSTVVVIMFMIHMLNYVVLISLKTFKVFNLIFDIRHFLTSI